MSFSIPTVSTNTDSWGPSETVENSKFHLLPYAPFGRSDRLGKVADFTHSFYTQTNNFRRDRRYNANDTNPNAEFQYKVQQDDFELVDTTKTPSFGGFSTTKKRSNQNRFKQLNARNNSSANTSASQFKSQKMKAGARGQPGRAGGYRERFDRQSSVSVKPEWEIVLEMDLHKLAKSVNNTDLPKDEDLFSCGFVDAYNDAYDKCQVKNSAVLKKSENKEFYPVTTTDDPVIEKLAIDAQGNVFATDAILSHLMTCTRSVYPWDIVVEKVASGALFFDKRDNSQFDYLTVCETSNSSPSPFKADDDPEGINTPERLALEATMINQNFSQQIVKSNARTHFDLPNPFYNKEDNDGMEAASVGYRYRRFDLGGDIQLVCRTELHGVVKKRVPGSSQSTDEYMTSFALNEYFDSVTQPKVSAPFAGIINWREKLDAQRGAVLATELKNNAFKLAKWTCQSILADAQQMKIGFVSRTSPKNPNDHQILATQFYRPKEFAQQITLNEGNLWGTFRIFVDMFRKQPEGKYVILKDPNKSQIKIYRVPIETFETEE